MNYKNIMVAFLFMMFSTFVPIFEIQNSLYNEDNKEGSLYSGINKNMNELLRFSLASAKANVKEKKVYETALSSILKNEALEGEIQEKERIEEEKECEELKRLESSPPNVPNDDPYCKSYAFSYMYGMNITSVNSRQYSFLHSNDIHADENGFFIDKDGRLLVAVGTFYADNIGDKVDIMFDDGSVMKCVVGDFKSDHHTDSSHRYYYGYFDYQDVDGITLEPLWVQGDGSVLEFILDYDSWNGYRPEQFESPHRIDKILDLTREGL